MPGRFTVYVEAASNPLVEADLPFAPMNLGERADGRPSDYVLTTMDVCAFNQNVFDYLMDLETVTSLMRELKDDDPRYWQLAKALQRSLNTYDERDIAGTLEPAKEKACRGIIRTRIFQRHPSCRGRPCAYRFRMAVTRARNPP